MVLRHAAREVETEFSYAVRYQRGCILITNIHIHVCVHTDLNTDTFRIPSSIRMPAYFVHRQMLIDSLIIYAEVPRNLSTDRIWSSDVFVMGRRTRTWGGIISIMNCNKTGF